MPALDLNRPAIVKTASLAQACETLVASVRAEILHSLARQISGRLWSAEVLEEFPFLADHEAFVVRYADCFVVSYEPDGVVLAISRERLKQHGFPLDLPVILEYGRGPIPVMPHLRSAMTEVSRLAQIIAGR